MSVRSVRQRQTLVLAMAAVLVGGMSCDRATSPPTTGEIVLGLQSGGPLGLDGVRVTANGPTSKTMTSGSLSSGLSPLQELAPGTYSVIVEGLIGGRVAWYGETTGVVVTRGVTTTTSVELTDFRPLVSTSTLSDTVHALQFSVSYSAVPHATTYVVEWSTSPTMSDASSAVVSGTTHEIAVAEEGQYYVSVRAANAAVPVGGLPSPTRPVYVVQTVATVTVLPLSPSIVDGTTQQFNATARDAVANVLTGITLFWSSSDHRVATVNQSGLVTSVGPGQATITAVAKGIPGSATLTVTSQAASKLVFTTQPANAVAGQAMASVRVAIQNPKNETAASDNVTQVTVALLANPGSGLLSGTATATVVNGVATFANLSVNKTGAGYTLQATATGLTNGVSTAFNITPGVATQLAWVVQPATTTAGDPFSPALQVELRDANGNRVTSARDPVTLEFNSNPGSATLGGTRVVNAIDGIASFSGLSIDNAATGYSLRAVSGALPNAASGSFDVIAGPAAGLRFNAQPVTTSTDGTIPVEVSVVDRMGNLVPTGPGVTVSIGTNPGAGTLSGTLTQPVVGGHATFGDLAIDRVGTGYTLVARAGALTAAMSNAFDMTVGVPNQLGFIVGPTDVEPQAPIPLEVGILDAHGNQTTVSQDVTIGVHVNPTGATLAGTLTVLANNGVAVFSDVSLDLGGSGYQLQATSPAVVGTHVSGSFTVGLEFVEVHAGDLNSCGLTVNGNAYCWGLGFAGGNGDGSGAADAHQPVRVVGGHTFTTLSTGYAHSCGIRANDGAAYCWGWGQHGQIGNGALAFNNATPQAVLDGHTFVAISAGARHTCALDEDGLAWCWGEQGLGRLGNNLTLSAQVTTPVAVLGAQVFSSISSGYEHTCAIQASDLAAYCWGNQLNGRLGNNLLVAGALGTPQLVQGGFTFLSISAGLHTCAIVAPDTDRRGRCWGANANGQLGVAVGDFTDRGLPTLIANSMKLRDLDASRFHTCAASVGGTGFCWGLTTAGRLGNGETSGNRETPQPVLGGLVITRIEAGTPGDDRDGDHSCAMTSAGAYCWGGNLYGYVGNGSTIQVAIPVKVRGQR